MNEKDVIGKRFGKLTVIAKAEKRDKKERWLCKCDCGKETVVQYNNLVTGNTSSCGCLRGADLTGKTFGFLTVLGRHHTDGRIWWLCQCVCGKETVVNSNSLLSGHTKSCGCHGMTKEQVSQNKSLYHIWWNMIQRCENPNAISYYNYGARGITVCEQWKDFHTFLKDMKEKYEQGLQLDRIDNEKGYSPKNCRWVTPKENAKNRRTNTWVTINGVRKLATQWSKHNSSSFLRRHQFDKNVLIEGGKYDNTQWHAEQKVKEARGNE